MKRYNAILVILLIMASMLIIPTPANALRYTMDTDLGNIDASFIGEYAEDESGHSIASAGDVNGDGYDDILIGTSQNDEGGDAAGQTYLILGNSSGWSMDNNLSNADASFIGEDYYDGSGFSVAGAGDVNGDGYDDILIGAPFDEDGGNAAGQTYLIFGKASGWAMDTNLSNADASFIGEDVWDESGNVAGAGDVNGDGYDDILIGARWNDEGGTKAGQTYLILGKASGWTMDTDLSNVDASFIGEDSDDYSGRPIAGAGDVNSDGYDDILIGATNDESGGSYAGQTYLILGKASGWAMDTDLSNADASFIGEDAWDYSGRSIAGAGDVNGDGFDDILIGASNNHNIGGTYAGQTYLILGKASGWVMDTDLSNVDASFIGEDEYDYSGFSVAGAGDVNGDGYDDILIGAVGDEEGGGSYAGQTYLILGNTSGWVMDIDLSNANASFIGENGNDESGYSVVGAGDVNGDGYDDILIGAMQNDDGGNDAGQIYLIFPDNNSKPTAITSVKAYSDDTFSIEVSKANINDTIYIELNGTDGNSSRKDIAIVNVTSIESSPRGFKLKLYETDLNTGIYHGNFTIKNRTHDDYQWIKALNTETVLVSSIQNPYKNASILVGKLVLYPLIDNLTAQEDEIYFIHYSTVDLPSINWLFKSNASWLDWNETFHNLTGISDNSDVGSYWVSINVTKGAIFSDEHNFTMVVNNTPPNITNEDILIIVQDQAYSVDYNSSDDGQGTITWHLATNTSSWLQINITSGNLTGTPTNAEVGSYWVNISVDDGNGGWDFSNFTLTVVNVNDPPEILTNDVLIAYEDEEYKMDYEAVDIDSQYGDKITWQMISNSSFLTMNSVTGMLSGTPTNDDVGVYWVNVTVSDLNLTIDFHNFTLTVINANDPPTILTNDVLTVFEDVNYYVDYEALDIDLSDSLSWHMKSNTTFLMMDSATGILSGTPGNDDVGVYWVNVTVSDLSLIIDSHNFTLTVINVNDPPIILTNDITTALEDEIYQITYEGTDIDIGDSLSWYMDSNTSFLSMDSITGILSGTPTNDDVGTYWVNISVEDNNEGFNFSNFTLTVLNVNDPPVITTENVQETQENEFYIVDYNASDIDSPLSKQIWILITNASNWLSIDSISGLLSGTPTVDDIGWYNVNVTVNDGDDGVDWQEFILLVKSIEKPEPDNQPPKITTIDKVSITVGEPYNVIYAAIDDHTPLNSLIWSYNSNASWLNFNKFTRVLSGNPISNHVGWYWVNVTVFDENGSSDFHNFTLTVYSNLNQAPIIITKNIINAIVGELYSVDYEANDDRTPKDNLQWSLDTNATSWLSINPNSGILSGIPQYIDIGSYWVKISVFDSEDGWDYQNFTVYVTTQPETTFPPELINHLMTPANGNTNTQFIFTIEYHHPIEYLPDTIQIVIDGNPFNMNLNNSRYEYKTQLSEGIHTYYFTTTQGKFTIKTENFTTSYIEKIDDKKIEDDKKENSYMILSIGIIVVIVVIFIILFFIIKRKKIVKDDTNIRIEIAKTPVQQPETQPKQFSQSQPYVTEPPIISPQQNIIRSQQEASTQQNVYREIKDNKQYNSPIKV